MDTSGQVPVESTRRRKRKRCRNCDKPFQTKLNWKTRKVLFCSDACRKEFHHHGSAFGPLRIKLEKMIDSRFRELVKKISGLEQRVSRLEAR